MTIHRPKEPFAGYLGKALAHEFSGLVYSALYQRQITVGQLNEMLGWSNQRLGLGKKLAGSTEATLAEVADIFLCLGFAAHFRLTGLAIEPLKQDPSDEDESA